MNQIDDNVPTFFVPDTLCNKTGITAKWVSGDKISINAYRHTTYTEKDRPTEYEEMYPVNIHHLQNEFIFNEPILRSLIGEANSIFVSVQRLKQNGTQAEFINISRTYRSTIRACIEKLQDKLTSDETEERNNKRTKEDYQIYITVFYYIECIWHLCEILYIDPTPSNVVVPQLLEWNRFHFPAYECQAAKYLQFEIEASSNPDFWNAVRGLILQGNKQIARALLRHHPSYNTNSFQIADDILEKMPVFNITCGLSLQKFKSQWQYWLNDTDSKLASGILSTEPELEKIIKLTTGDTLVWNEVVRKSTSWYEFFPGFIFYTEPGCKHFELGTFANSWLTRWFKAKGNKDVSLKFLDNVILNIMKNDMNQVLHDIQNINDNQWIAVHLSDLLYHCGQLEILDDSHKNVSGQLRESLLFDFGSSLMSRDSLWVFGIDYLENCSKEGLAAMEIFLSKIPLKNEKYALKILSVARSKGMKNLETEICRTLVSKSLSNLRHGNALEWALRSQDYSIITSLADKILKNYCKTGTMLCKDILSNIGPKMLISPRLVFLVKYHDFHDLYVKTRYDESSELLVNLLASQLTPEYFWPTVLADTIPFLESEDQLISSKETYVIIHYIEQKLSPLIEKQKRLLKQRNVTQPEYTSKGDSESSALYLNPKEESYFFNEKRIETIEELIKMLRLACARNLARSLIMENTSNRSLESNY